MGHKGSSTSSSNTSSTYTPAGSGDIRTALNAAESAAQTPYQPYTGELVAPFNNQQNVGLGNINNAYGMAQPAYNTAINAATNASQPLTSDQINQYLNPYIQGVVDPTVAEFQNINAQQQQGVLGNAISQHALGGNRSAIAQTELAHQQSLAQNPVIAGLYSQGYNQAVQTAQQQQQQQTNAAYALGQLGAGSQTSALQGAGAQLAAGTQQQQTSQAQDTAQYQQYLNALGYPFQESQFLSQAVGALAPALGGTTTGSSFGTSTPAQPSPYGQAAGLALTGLSLFSDERVKENIHPVGKMFDGSTIYRYNFKGDPRTQIGLIAQEVEHKHPEAVHDHPSGVKMVDYDAATHDAAHRQHFAGGGLAVPYAAQGYIPAVGGIQASPAPNTGGAHSPSGAPQTPPQSDPMKMMKEALGLGKSLKDSFNSGPLSGKFNSTQAGTPELWGSGEYVGPQGYNPVGDTAGMEEASAGGAGLFGGAAGLGASTDAMLPFLAFGAAGGGFIRGNHLNAQSVFMNEQPPRVSESTQHEIARRDLASTPPGSILGDMIQNWQGSNWPPFRDAIRQRDTAVLSRTGPYPGDYGYGTMGDRLGVYDTSGLARKGYDDGGSVVPDDATVPSSGTLADAGSIFDPPTSVRPIAVPTIAPPATPSAPTAAVAPVRVATPISGAQTPGGLGDLFSAKEKQYGLPAGYLAYTYQREGTDQNPRSSANGPFQFIDQTAKEYGVSDKHDIGQTTDGAARLGRDSYNKLKAGLGREPTIGEIYLGHQQGPDGAVALLTNPGARAVDIVGARAVVDNGGDANMTAAQFAKTAMGNGRPANSNPRYTQNATGTTQTDAPLSLPKPFLGFNPLGVSDQGRTAMLAAGLGMLASGSPFAGVAIGQGGLQGVSTYEKATELSRQADLARAQISHLGAQTALTNVQTESAKDVLGATRKLRDDPMFGNSITTAPAAKAPVLNSPVIAPPPSTPAVPGRPGAPSASGNVKIAGPDNFVPDLQQTAASAQQTLSAAVGVTNTPQGPALVDVQGKPIENLAITRAKAQRLIDSLVPAFVTAGESMLKYVNETTKLGGQLATDGSIIPIPGAAETQARAAGQKSEAEAKAQFPYKVVEAAAQRSGMPISVKEGEPVITGAQANPDIAAIVAGARKQIEGRNAPPPVSQAMPGAVAPLAPATGGFQQTGAMPSQDEAGGPEAHGFTPGVIRRPDGSVISTLTATNKKVGDEVAAFVNDKQKTLSAQGDTIYMARQLRHALEGLPSGPGTDNVNEAAQFLSRFDIDLNSVLPNGWQTDPTKYSLAIKNINQLAAGWARTEFPQRITNNDLALALRANISLLNTPAANQHLLDNLESIGRARQEEAKFYRGYMSSLPRGAYPDWRIIDEWNGHLKGMKGIDDEVKIAYLAQSDQQNASLMSHEATRMPAGATSRSTNKAGQEIFSYKSPEKGWYWGDRSGKPIDGQ